MPTIWDAHWLLSNHVWHLTNGHVRLKGPERGSNPCYGGWTFPLSHQHSLHLALSAASSNFYRVIESDTRSSTAGHLAARCDSLIILLPILPP